MEVHRRLRRTPRRVVDMENDALDAEKRERVLKLQAEYEESLLLRLGYPATKSEKNSFVQTTTIRKKKKKKRNGSTNFSWNRDKIVQELRERAETSKLYET